MHREAPLRIFLSHTSELREHPRGRSYVDAAEAAVMRAGHAISNMAYFAARDTELAEYCVTEVGRADVFVGVIGMRYGAMVRDRPDVSYPELEFEAATSAGIPRLILLVTDDAAGLPAVEQLADHVLRQQAFRRRLQESGVTTVWVASPAGTELGLYQALVDTIGFGSQENTDYVCLVLARVMRHAKCCTVRSARSRLHNRRQGQVSWPHWLRLTLRVATSRKPARLAARHWTWPCAWVLNRTGRT